MNSHRFFLKAIVGIFLAGSWGVSVSAEDIQVVKAGKFYGNVYAYRVEDAFYIGAKDSARLYGGNVYWHPVKGQVQISLRGRQILFQADSNRVEVNGSSIEMSRPMLVRTSQAFIPIDFFCSPEFSDVSGLKSSFDPKTRLLAVDLGAAASALRAAAPSGSPAAREAPSPQAPLEVSPKSEPEAPKKQARVRYRIVIDAGHGGKDSGAIGYRGLKEKSVNLSAAKELARLLEQQGNFDVLLTRGSDVFVPLAERSSKANEFNADLFVSLHCNAHSSRSESGYEIYFLSERASDPEAARLAEFENSALSLEGKGAEEDEAAGLLYALARTEFINDSSELAGLMARTLAKRVDLSNRGVKQASFYVLRGANEPSVLVEMGFVTNRTDAAKLQFQKYRRKLVQGLYAAILDFAKRKEWAAGKAK